MKSLLQNNSALPGLGDNLSPLSKDAGIFDRAPGKKDPASKSDSGFADFLMQAVQNDRKAAPPSSPKMPDIQAPRPKADDRQAADKIERDLAERKSMSSTPSRTEAEQPQAQRMPKDDASATKAEASKHTKTETTQSKDANSSGAEAAPDESRPAEATGRSTAATELRALKKAVGNKAAAEGMIGNNAVLAFITGRLDRLDPDGIPGIITGSPFLKQAVSAQEISELMTEPMSISELSRLFELDQSILNKAVANGLDSSAMVTPKDFLQAVGVDPGIVSSELTMLQQKLPIEGVKSYVDRARAMSLASKNRNTGGGDIEQMMTAMQASLGSTAIAAEPGIAADQNQDVTTRDNSMPQAPTAAIAGGIAAPTPQSIQRPQMSDAAIKPTQVSRRTTSSSVPSTDLIENILSQRVAAPMQVAEPKIDISISPETDVTVDPFQSLGHEMQGLDINRMTYEATNVGQSMANLEEQLAANGFVVKANTPEIKSPKVAEDMVLPSQVSRDDISELISEDSFKQDFSFQPKEMTQPTLSEGLNTLAGFSSSSQSSLFSENHFSDERGDSSQQSAETLLRTATPIASGKVAEAEGFTIVDKPTTQNTSHFGGISQKIMQHANMMIKDGGGSMRMDIDAPGMGKIDLAIQLNNNQLDVRILTPNEQVRDIINKELSGLRDGLGQQGISLRTVEVGHAQQGSQQFAGGNFGRGANGQQASYNEMKEYAQKFADNFTPRNTESLRNDVFNAPRSVSSAWMNSARDASRIAIRI